MAKVQQQRQQQIKEVEEKLHLARSSSQADRDAISKKEHELKVKENELIRVEKSIEIRYIFLYYIAKVEQKR